MQVIRLQLPKPAKTVPRPSEVVSNYLPYFAENPHREFTLLGRDCENQDILQLVHDAISEVAYLLGEILMKLEIPNVVDIMLYKKGICRIMSPTCERFPVELKVLKAHSQRLLPKFLL